MTSVFKQCPYCKHCWSDRDEFLSDPTVKITGYQVHYHNILEGLYTFLHTADDCKASLSLPVWLFVDMHDGTLHDFLLAGTSKCEGKCKRVEDIRMCSQKCSCSYARNIIQKILKYNVKTP
ncbi:MAG: hypothetical protein AB1454_07045 [Candidatus Auribacterota bacterium]|jgi:hypothetical protein|uniref:Uncharacterized protein n=1 Tax=Candidatus Auribacter fodinae TaxID=2093366 RepID=A0A3A4QXG3_9BACT|nr:MAG: hypothetical protein C4541_07680 [Candidatus Auribacter fodinae]